MSERKVEYYSTVYWLYGNTCQLDKYSALAQKTKAF